MSDTPKAKPDDAERPASEPAEAAEAATPLLTDSQDDGDALSTVAETPDSGDEDDVHERKSPPPTPRGLRLPDDDEDDEDDVPVRVMGTGARAEKEKRRIKTLVRGRRGPQVAAIPPDQTLEGKLILYVLDQLSPKEREGVRAEIETEENAKHRLKVIRRHLEIHESLPSVRPRAGSFLRLVRRMREADDLAFAYPGGRAIWRRSFGFALLSAVAFSLLLAFGPLKPKARSSAGVPFGSFTRKLVDDESESQPISLNTPLTTGTEGGYLWLSTQRSGVATEVRTDGAASFNLVTRSLLSLDSGTLTRVKVRSEALYKDGFQIQTKHGTISTFDGEFSVEAQSGRTIVNVARGRVQVQRAKSSEVRMVSDGWCAEISENENNEAVRLYPFVRVDIQPSQTDRVALVTIVNLSQHEIALRSIGYNFGEAYSCMLAKDYQSGDYRQLTYRGRISVVQRDESLRGALTLENDWIVLEANGNTQFFADLTAETLGWGARDLSFSVAYHDLIRSETFGAMHFPVMSNVERMNLKDDDLINTD